MAKQQGIWDDWVSLHAMVWTLDIQPAILFRFCFPITSLFHLRRNYSWSPDNSCFWSFDEVLAWYAPLCRHGLPYIFPYPINSYAQTLGRMLTPVIGCGEVWPAKSAVLEYCVDLPSFIVNRWLAVRFNLLSSVVVGVTGLVCLVTPGISASTAGFALTFASTIADDLFFVVCFKWK